MIRVEGFRKEYADRVAVEGSTFEARPGEVLGLVGPNGAGKTTTLRAIAGILPPTAGRIAIGGHDLATAPLQAKRRLGFIPDQPQLFDLLTVDEHLALTARLYGVPDLAARRAALYAELELEGRGSALPGSLSRGMRQKVAVACGLLHDPAAILFDEPLTGLDPVAIRRLKHLMRARADAGAAVIVSSHLLGLVEEIADRVLILQEGRIRFLGPLDALRSTVADGASDRLEELFLKLTGGQA